MSGRERTVKPERRQPRRSQTPEEIKAVCDLFRELLREEYARQDAEDAKLSGRRSSGWRGGSACWRNGNRPPRLMRRPR
jgi:hypothetical protein